MTKNLWTDNRVCTRVSTVHSAATEVLNIQCTQGCPLCRDWRIVDECLLRQWRPTGTRTASSVGAVTADWGRLATHFTQRYQRICLQKTLIISFFVFVNLLNFMWLRGELRFYSETGVVQKWTEKTEKTEISQISGWSPFLKKSPPFQSPWFQGNLILCKRDYLRLFGSTGFCAACNKVSQTSKEKTPKRAWGRDCLSMCISCWNL